MASDASAPPETDAPRPRRRLVLLLVVPLVAALGGGGIAFTQADRLAAIVPGAAAATAPDGQPAPERPAKPATYGQFMQLPNVIVNPAGSGGRRYLMVDLGVEAANDKPLAEVKEKEVVIRDAVVGVLSGYSVEELADVGLREALKDTLLVTVNGILTRDVDRLYFTQYVLQ